MAVNTMRKYSPHWMRLVYDVVVPAAVDGDANVGVGVDVDAVAVVAHIELVLDYLPVVVDALVGRMDWNFVNDIGCVVVAAVAVI